MIEIAGGIVLAAVFLVALPWIILGILYLAVAIAPPLIVFAILIALGMELSFPTFGIALLLTAGLFWLWALNREPAKRATP